GIKNGKIAQIGGLKGKTAERVLDATGRIVAPGFVDLHTHYDAQIFWDPYCTLSGWHGVTSVALGNCGFGFAPSRELAYQETGEEGRPLAEATKQFFEKVAAVAKRPILYQAVAPNAVHPEMPRERIKWLESWAERGLR